MANCDDFIQNIPETECIGDSLSKINDNFTSLKDELCALINQFPPGIILEYAGPTAPQGWLICDGTNKAINEFPDLYAVLQTRYGPGTADTFALPNLVGRTVIGAGITAGITTRVLAAKGGEEEVALSINNLAAHTHTVTDPGHTHTVSHSHTISGDPGHTHSIAGHTHNVYAGYEAGSNVLSLASEIGEALASSNSAFFNHTHAFGYAFRGIPSVDVSDNMPSVHILDNHSTGNGTGTSLLSGSGNATGYFIEQLGGVTYDTQLQITIASIAASSTGSGGRGSFSTQVATPTTSSGQTSISVASNGSGAKHNNMQPFLVLNFIIKT